VSVKKHLRTFARITALANLHFKSYVLANHRSAVNTCFHLQFLGNCQQTIGICPPVVRCEMCCKKMKHVIWHRHWSDVYANNCINESQIKLHAVKWLSEVGFW